MTLRFRALCAWPVLMALVASSAVAQSAPAATTYLSEQPVRARHAMVVTVHHLATDAGVEILRQGGNAVDAAVGVGFALAVVYPFAGNLGGGGFMLVHLAGGEANGRANGQAGGKGSFGRDASTDNSKNASRGGAQDSSKNSAHDTSKNSSIDTFIDYRERAPLAATANMYLDAQGKVIPNASIIGYRAIGVPGSVAGLVYAERKYGRLGLERVMAPAIQLAAEGFVLSAGEAQLLRDPHLAEFAASRAIFQRNGNLYQAGERFRQPELAETLRRIAANPEDFYRGAMARQIAAAVEAGGGLITTRDMASYTAKERVPVRGSYDGYTVVSAPPPSSGGITLIEALNILDGYNLKPLGDRTPEEMHLILEAYRRAYMDRNEYLGDPDYVKMPVAAMLSQRYAAAWRAGIDPEKATPSRELLRPAGFLPAPPTMGEVRQEAADTTHYSVVDAEGDAVAVTTTLNGAFGSYVTVPGLGFLLNDEMDDFAAKQGVPNMFGLIQGPANSIAPGKRPLSSMTPTIVLRDGKVRFVLGSPGGSRIITTVANILLSSAEEGLNIQAAVDAPRFHHQYLPDVVDLEAGFPEATVKALEARGYTVKLGGHWSDGECIAVDPVTGELEGGHDHRHGFGAAAGY